MGIGAHAAREIEILSTVNGERRQRLPRFSVGNGLILTDRAGRPSRPFVDTKEGRCYGFAPFPTRSCGGFGDRVWNVSRSEDVLKRTFQPHRKSRKRTHGFRKRMRTRAGREVLRRRRRKGRRQLTVTVAKK